MNEVENEIYYKNFNCEIIKEPFEHSIYNFLSKDICDKLIINIKQIHEVLKSDPLLSKSRFKINLNGNTIDGISNKNFLENIKNIKPLCHIIKEYEYTIPKLLYKKYNKTEKNIISYTIMIVCDIENYEIGPHTDSHIRNSTMITYLGPIVNDENLGLNIYKDKVNRHEKVWNKTHYSFDNFEKIKQIDYYPGSSIDFKVSKNSYHGVPKIINKCDRYSIQFFIHN